MQRSTLLSIAVSAALGGALPALHAAQDSQPEGRSQGTEDHLLWDRNEYRSTDMARWDGSSKRDEGWRRDDGWRGHRDLREGDRRDLREIERDKREIRQDWREIREDRGQLNDALSERAHNRDQLKVARAIGDQPGVEWERNQIRQNNIDIRRERGELRSDFRELRQDKRELRGDLRDAGFRGDRDHRDFHSHDRDQHQQHASNDRSRRDFGHERGHNGRSTEASKVDGKAMVQVKADVKK